MEQAKFENVQCIFCGPIEQKILLRAPDRLNKLPGIFTLVRCSSCGLIFQNPRPDINSIKYYYPDNTGYFKPAIPNKKRYSFGTENRILANYYGYYHLGKRSLVTKILLFPIYLFFYRYRSIPRFVKNGQLLEIGCSNGAYLQSLKNWGWGVVGVETNQKAAFYAKNSRKLDVIQGDFNQLKLPSNFFDVIIMDMVLEHLYDPKSAIKKATILLKKGGHLIFSIPFYSGVEFRIYKQYFYSLHLPNHLYFFSKRNLINLLKDFKKIKLIFYSYDRDVVASSGYIQQDNREIFWYLLANSRIVRLLIIKPIIFLLSLYKLTSRVTIKAVKV